MEKNAYFAIFINILLLYEIVWKSIISIFFIYEKCMITISLSTREVFK